MTAVGGDVAGDDQHGVRRAVVRGVERLEIGDGDACSDAAVPIDGVP